jgi:hypothetical protein
VRRTSAILLEINPIERTLYESTLLVPSQVTLLLDSDLVCFSIFSEEAFVRGS